MTRSRKQNTRAEKIRERRSKQGRKPKMSSRGKVDTTSHQMPPVMVRGRGYAPAVNSRVKRKSKRLKRRYDIALATPGVEIRLPSTPVVRLGWRVLSFLLVVGFLGIIYYFWTSPYFQVQMVEVKGALRLSADEINRMLNIYNKPVFILNPRQMEENLKVAYPELKNVSIQIGLPAAIVVHVSERVPLIAWIQDSVIEWVDGDGYAFPPRGEAEKLVPVQAYASPPKPEPDTIDSDPMELIGEFRAFMQPELVAGILVMRAQAPEGTDLIYDPQYGLGWKDPRGWDIFFGLEGDDIESKLVVYKSIVEKLEAKGVTPTLINLEHIHAPYYRLEQ